MSPTKAADIRAVPPSPVLPFTSTPLSRIASATAGTRRSQAFCKSPPGTARARAEQTEGHVHVTSENRPLKSGAVERRKDGSAPLSSRVSAMAVCPCMAATTSGGLRRAFITSGQPLVPGRPRPDSGRPPRYLREGGA